MFWNENFLNELRQYISDKIVKMQYRTGDSWNEAIIAHKIVQSNKVKLIVLITEQGSFTINGIRILGNDNEVIAEINENITKGSDTLTMQWDFPLYEIQST